ncbi:unnamed protein product [Penicillium manginii]
MSKISTSHKPTRPAAARVQRAGTRPGPRTQKAQAWPDNDVDAVQPVSPLMQKRSYIHVPRHPRYSPAEIEKARAIHPVCDETIQEADECYRDLVAKLAQEKKISEEQIKRLEEQVKKLTALLTQANAEKQQFSEEACKWENEAISRQKLLDEMSRATQDNVTWEQVIQMLNELHTISLSVSNAIFMRMMESNLMMKPELVSLSPTAPATVVDTMPWPHSGRQSSISSNSAATENTSPMLAMLHSQSPASIDPGLIMH